MKLMVGTLRAQNGLGKAAAVGIQLVRQRWDQIDQNHKWFVNYFAGPNKTLPTDKTIDIHVNVPTTKEFIPVGT